MKITYQLHLPMLVDHVEKDRNQKMHEMVNVEMHVPVIKFRQILYIFSWIKFIYNYTTIKFCQKKTITYISYLSRSVNRLESRKPLANGFESIFNFVIYKQIRLFTINKNQYTTNQLILICSNGSENRF